MYHGAHIKNDRPGKNGRHRVNKAACLLLAIVLVIGAAVGTTIAFLVADTEPVKNQFEYAKVSCAVQENFDGVTKKDVRIQNTGTTDAFIRATYVVNWVDGDGNIAASVPEGYSYTLTENPGGNWTKIGEYFYYLTPVAPGDVTPGSLLECKVTYPANPEYTLSVEILATAIQSSPASAVTEAWGVEVPSAGN